MKIGFVKWFSFEKGYGVIEDMDDNKEYFCHIKDLSRSIAIRLDQDTIVFYTPSFDEKKKRNTTHDIKLVRTIEDLRKVFASCTDHVEWFDSKNTYFVNGIVSFLQYSESSDDKSISEDQFNDLVSLITNFSSARNRCISLLNIIRKAANKRYKKEKAEKFIEMIEVKLISDLPESIALQMKSDDFASIYSSLFFCIVFPQCIENNVTALLSKYNFHTIFEFVCRLIADINGEPCASAIKENNKLLTKKEFFKDLEGSNLLFTLNKYVMEKLDTQKIIQLYKEGYVPDISQQYVENHIADLHFHDLQLLFEDLQIEKDDELEIIKRKICIIFRHEVSETIWRYIDYGETIAEDKDQWLVSVLKTLSDIDYSRYTDFKVYGYIIGKWKVYDEEFVCSNINKFTTSHLGIIIDKYALSANQVEKLYLSDIKCILLHGPKDYSLERKSNPWGYDYYEEIKKVYPLVSDKDWITRNSNSLSQIGEKYVDLVLRLYKDGFFEHLNDRFVVYYLDKLSISEVVDILSNNKVETDQRKKILREIFFKMLRNTSNEKLSSIRQIMNASHSLLGSEWKEWDNDVEKDSSDEELFCLWKERIIEICPYDYIKFCFLNYDKRGYEEYYSFYTNGMIPKDKAKELLWQNIKPDDTIDDREEFYKRFYSVKYLLMIDDSEVEAIREMQIDIYNVFLWYLSFSSDFNFEVLAKKFIYFEPFDQVRIIKGLFYLADKGIFTLTVEMLESIVRVDSDLYKLISQNHPFIPVDVSTEIVVKALAHLYRNGNFSTDKDVLNIIINASRYTKKERIKIGSYFDVCPGRLSYKRDKSKTPLGKISMLSHEMYSVSVATSIPVQTYSRYSRPYDKYTNNPDFQNIVDAIKKMPGSRWNPTNKAWEVPTSNKEELFNIAKKYGLIIEGQWNYHMFTYKCETEDRPSGIDYCEGRPSIVTSKITDSSFLWCRSQECHRQAVSSHDSERWMDYTLLDFCRILGLETNSKDQKGRDVQYGKYLSFSSLINRANSILEHLYCRECGQMLEPVEISNYYSHLVTKFHCTNSKCGMFHESIYISKCFNWKCHGVIDERDDKKCPNSWVICPVCGSCCSNRIMEQRLNNRMKLGLGSAPFLENFVRMKLGHLEKREFYCFKCGSLMESNGPSRFVCRTCGIEYNRQPYDYEVRYAPSNNGSDNFS